MSFQAAKETWLKAKGRGSTHTERVYRRAIEGFERHLAPLGLGEVGGAEVESWANALTDRGLASSTINAYLSAVSSFYDFCMTSYTDRSGRGLATFNPVDAVERQRVEPFDQARHLTFPQARRLLETIDRTTPHGARDYAMIKMGFYTGRRPTEIREIRWGDIQHTADGRVRYHWTGKGSKSRWDDLPHPVYEAICVYLEQTGRREGIHADDYVFVPHDAAGDPRNETISQQWFNDLVKGYAQEAGLGDWVHAHTLRHTAAAFRDEVGEDLWAIGRLLNHSDPKTTQVYVPRLRGYQDTGWRRVQQLLEGESAPCWLDTLDEALCALASAADDKYTEDVAQAHGILQAVLGGVESIGRLLEPVG